MINAAVHMLASLSMTLLFVDGLLITPSPWQKAVWHSIPISNTQWEYKPNMSLPDISETQYSEHHCYEMNQDKFSTSNTGFFI